MTTTNRSIDDHVVEAQLGTRLAAGLNASVEHLPHDVNERLRFAREQALSRVRQARQAAGVVAVGASSGGVAALVGFTPWWQRAMAVVPLVVLLGGLLLIDHWSIREQVLAAADVDSQLLADELPPSAYSDPGFAEYLRDAPAP
jgi:hypothetical protein